MELILSNIFTDGALTFINSCTKATRKLNHICVALLCGQTYMYFWNKGGLQFQIVFQDLLWAIISVTRKHIKQIVSDSNIFLWYESEDTNKKS